MKKYTIKLYFLVCCFSVLTHAVKTQNEPYHGGSGAGHAVLKIGSDVIYTYSSVHAGGDGDGFSVLKYGSDIIYKYPNVFSGGAEDGFAMDKVGHDILYTYPAVFGGGVTDGYTTTDLACTYSVTVKQDEVPGCFKWAIACAVDGDTIRFYTALIGDTLWITDDLLHMKKSLVFLSEGDPQVLASTTMNPFLHIPPSLAVELRNLNLASYESGGTLLSNEGNLTIHDLILILSDENGLYLHNKNNGEVEVKGHVDWKIQNE